MQTREYYPLMTIIRHISFAIIIAVTLAACCGCREEAAKGLPTQDGKKLIEVSVFQGGYGIDFWQKCAADYEKLHPDVKVNIWGDPRNDEKLRPRFIAGTPPDLVYANLPVWILIAAKQCYPLNKFLDEPPYADSRGAGLPRGAGVSPANPAGETPAPRVADTWRDTLLPMAYRDFTQEGECYALNVPYAIYGFWCDRKQFRQHRWQTPKTWDEFLALCERIKNEGIDPIAFQGRYPTYITSLFETLVQRMGGTEKWLALQNMEPGAWTDPVVIKALEMVQELRKRDYIPASYMGLSHMESQMKFVQGKAAMIPCGTWLATEMKSSTPEGFEYGFIPYPSPAGSVGDTTAIIASGEYWFVPAHANYPEIGADMLRFVTSLQNAKGFVQSKRALFAVKGAEENPPPALAEAVDALHAAKFTFTSQVSSWYKTFDASYNEVCGNLLSLDWTPQQCADYLEKAAGAQRRDKRTKLHKMLNPETGK